jgi:hypothetical protein
MSLENLSRYFGLPVGPAIMGTSFDFGFNSVEGPIEISSESSATRRPRRKRPEDENQRIIA